MAQQTHLVQSDEPVRVTVEPLNAQERSWFRLFRSVVHSGVWASLPPAASKVLIVLAECVNDSMRRENGRWIAWPSVATIAKRSGCERRAVQKAIGILEERDLVRRCRRRNHARGDFSNEYELVCPRLPAPEETSGGAHQDALPPAHIETHTGASLSTVGQRRQPRRASAAGNAQQSIEFTEKRSDSSIRAQLADAGIGEPVLSRLITENTEDELLLRFRDWKTRQKLGSKLGVAWLIASIRQKYELHDHTQREIDGEKKAAVVKVNRVRALEKEAEAERALAEIDRQTRAMLDAMSDEELAHWKSVVIAEYPTLFRQPTKVDPATDKRLRTLILGKLAHLVAPELADACEKVGPAQL